MLKKRTAILFLTLAYAILLGHNIIPHHHHGHDHDVTEHQQTNHNHPDDGDNGMDNPYSQLIHPDDGFTFTTSHNITNTFSKQQLSLVAVLPDIILLGETFIPPLLYKRFAEQVVYISPHSHPSGLRAPPATFI